MPLRFARVGAALIAGVMAGPFTPLSPSPRTQVANETTSTDPGNSSSTTVTTTSTPPRWTLVFGGDTLLTRPISERTKPFARVQPRMADADVAIVNLETALTTGGTRAVKEFTFRSPPAFAQVLADAGVDVVSLANNHSLDFGQASLLETIEHLNNAGIGAAGAGVNLADALTPITVDVHGIKVAVLAATQIIPAGNWLATQTRPGLVGAGKQQLDENARRLAGEVQRATFDHDVVVVVLHWGFEGDSCPNGTQQLVAEMLFDAGATAVLGAHPHVLQPIVNRTDGKVVAYSMGNFIWDPRSGSTGETGLLELVFEGSKLVDTVFHPHRLDGNGWAAAVTDRSAAARITARTTKKCPDRRPDRSRPRRS